MSNKGTVFTGKAVAGLLNLSEKRIKQLTHDGIIKEECSGFYRLAPTIRAYVKYLQSQIADDDSSSNYNVEKARLTRIKREGAELEFRLKKNELHKSSAVEFIVTNMLIAFKANLNALPYKLLPDLLNLPDNENKKDAIISILSNAVDSALIELAAFDPETLNGHEEIQEQNDTGRT